jgi:hypothetical protein
MKTDKIPGPDTRQDRNGRFIRIGSDVEDYRGRHGTVVRLSSMCWIKATDGKEFGVNCDDVEVIVHENL